MPLFKIITCLMTAISIFAYESRGLAQERVFWSADSASSSLQLATPMATLPIGNYTSLHQRCRRNVCSETLQWTIDDKPVLGYSIKVIHTADETFLINGWAPAQGLYVDVAENSHLPLALLGYEQGRAAWTIQDDTLLPVWQVASPDQTSLWTIHASTGELLAENPLWFDLSAPAKVLDPVTHRSRDVILEHLTNNKYLDGKYASVFAPDKQADRASQDDDGFVFGLTGQEGDRFDQVQAYFSANSMRQWLAQYAGNDLLSHIKIRIGDPGISADNAAYNTLTQEIAVGTGESLMKRPARDFDVIAHEYGHHFIANFVPSKAGDGGLLHEGFADYFVYAFKNKPRLVEIALRDADYLRTAKVDDDQRFDNPEVSADDHSRGQLWSAMLWQVRQKQGKQFDQVVVQAVMSLSERPTLAEAIKVLLAADRSTVSSNPLLSSSHCSILNAAVGRGLATWIEDLDGSACDLDLVALANESRSYTDSLKENKPSSSPSFSNPCGVVGDVGTNHTNRSLLILMTLLFPIVFLALHQLVQTQILRSFS